MPSDVARRRKRSEVMFYEREIDYWDEQYADFEGIVSVYVK